MKPVCLTHFTAISAPRLSRWKNCRYLGFRSSRFSCSRFQNFAGQSALIIAISEGSSQLTQELISYSGALPFRGTESMTFLRIKLSIKDRKWKRMSFATFILSRRISNCRFCYLSSTFSMDRWNTSTIRRSRRNWWFSYQSFTELLLPCERCPEYKTTKSEGFRSLIRKPRWHEVPDRTYTFHGLERSSWHRYLVFLNSSRSSAMPIAIPLLIIMTLAITDDHPFVAFFTSLRYFSGFRI